MVTKTKWRLSWPLLLTIISALILSFNLGTDPDFWYHLKTGEVIFENKALPSGDIFSFTAEGRPWILHEWLFQLFLFAVFKNLSWAGIWLFKFALIILLTIVFYKLIENSLKGNVWLILSTTLLGVVLFQTSLNLRPQIISLIFLNTLLLALFKKLSRKAFLFLPLLFLFWTNLHGGVIFGLLVLFALTISSWERKELLLRRGKLLILCLLASLINPNLFKNIFYLFAVNPFRASRYTIEYWPPLLLYQLTWVKVYFLALIFVWLGWLWHLKEKQKKFLWQDFLFLSFFSLISLRFVRTVPIFAIAVLPFAAKYWQAFLKEAKKKRWALALKITPLLLLTMIGFSVFTSGEKPRFPQKAADFLLTHSFGGNLYNHYNWGSYLLYRLYPSYKIFVDGRTELYIKDIYEDFLTLRDAKDGWEKLLSKYDFQFAIVSNAELKDGLGHRLFYQRKWALLHWDDVAAVLAKRNGENNELIKKFEKKAILPFSLYGAKPRQERQAITEYKKILKEEDVNNFYATLGLANVYFYQLKDLQRAKIMYEGLVKRKPKISQAHLTLGLIYTQEQKYKEAAEEFKKVIRLEPTNWEAYKNLGIIYHQYLDEPKKARGYLEKYLNLVEGTEKETEETEEIRKLLEP